MKLLMLKPLSFLFLFVFTSSIWAQAPILTYEDYNLDLDGISLVVGNGANGIPTIPEAGADMIWDYGNLTGEDVVDVQPWSEFETCLAGPARLADQSIGAIGNQVRWLYEVSETGIRSTTMDQIGQFIFLGNGGGLLWRDTCLQFPEDQFWLPFPVTYQHAWERDIIEDRPFAIEIPDVIEATNGNVIRRTVALDSVSGWGTVIIPGANGPLSFEALLMEQTVFQQDSMFQEGQAASDSLLNLLNFNQGRSSLVRTYTLRSNQNEILFVMATDFFGNHLYHAYLANPDLPNATTAIEINTIKLYPNPTSERLIQLDCQSCENQQLNIHLLNSLGQVMDRQSLVFSETQNIKLPQNSPSGFYYLVLFTTGQQLVAKLPFVLE